MSEPARTAVAEPSRDLWHRLSRARAWYNQRYHVGEAAPPDPWRGWHRWLLQQASPAPGEALLDVGCGSGGFLAVAGELGLAAHGIDLCDRAVAQARLRVPQAAACCCAAESLPFADGSFDIVSALGSIEHCQDISRALRELHRVGRRGTRYLLVVPNARYLGWRLMRNVGTQQQEVGEILLSRPAWVALLHRHGLRVCRTWPDRRPMSWAWIGESPRARRPFTAVKALAMRALPLDRQYQFVFLAERL